MEYPLASGGGIAKDDWYLDKIQLQVTVDDKTDILMFNFQKWIGYGKKYEAKEVRAPGSTSTIIGDGERNYYCGAGIS